MAKTAAPALTLRLERVLKSTPEAVFDAWTKPDKILGWWHDAAAYDKPIVEVDLKVGGQYRIAKTHRASGAEHSIRGSYREIERPKKLVFTWKWDNEQFMKETTRVTVELFAQPAAGGVPQTKLALTHEKLPSQDLFDKHSMGWTQCIDRMEAQNPAQ